MTELLLTCGSDGCVREPGHEGAHVVWGGFKYSTARNLKRKTDGRRIAKIASGINKPGMPWQREVWDVATERDAFGRLVYEIVFVTVPRQSGKTTLYGPVQLDRVITIPGIKTFYTAQTGKDARSRFNDLVALVQASPLDAVARYRFSAGDEGILFPNGSALKIFAPVVAALHGETPPLVGMDEIWELTETLGDALLEGAIIPAQVTLFGQRQIWLMSTAGTAESGFYWGWVDRGREAVRTRGKSDPKLAYFEAGLPDGADPYDPAVIAAFHPAVGHTQTVPALLEISKQVSRATWLRAFCNVRVDADEPIFTDEQLRAVTMKPKAVPSLSDVAITYAIADGGTDGAVYATWRDIDGVPCSRVLHAAPGTVWMHGFIVTLTREWNPRVLGADDGGKTRRLTERLRRTLRDEREVITTAGREFSTAGDQLLEGIRTQEFRLDGSRTTLNGFAHLVERRVQDVTAFSRQQSTGSIVGPECIAVGLWLYDHNEPDDGSFLIR